MLKIFKLNEFHSSLSNEVIGGLTTFLASFYIIIVTPAMLSVAGLPFNAVLTGTVVTASLATLIMGVLGNNPILLAPGLGLNAFFTFSLIIGEKLSPEIALGVVFWSGIIFLLLSLLNIREKLIKLVPLDLRHAISCGIGVFFAFIGLEKGGVVISSPDTMVQMAGLGPQTITFFLCLFLCGIYVRKNFKGALLLGILTTLVFAIPLGRLYGTETLVSWKGFLSTPDFSWFFKMNLKDSFTLALIPTIISFMFTSLFDTLSSFLGVTQAGNLLDEKGNPRNLKRSLVADSLGTIISSVCGTGPTTSFIESSAGIQAGARTGLASVVTGLLFLPFLFLAPLLSMFPVFTTAPILIIVGTFMISGVRNISWEKFEIALPAFLAIVMIPLTFSITKGMISSLVCYYFMKLLLRSK